MGFFTSPRLLSAYLECISEGALCLLELWSAETQAWVLILLDLLQLQQSTYRGSEALSARPMHDAGLHDQALLSVVRGCCTPAQSRMDFLQTLGPEPGFVSPALPRHHQPATHRSDLPGCNFSLALWLQDPDSPLPVGVVQYYCASPWEQDS